MDNRRRGSTLIHQDGTCSHIRVFAFAFIGFFLGMYLMYAAYPFLETTLSVQNTDAISEGLVAISDPSSNLPQRLRIPAIGIDTVFETPLRLNEDKTIAVPASYEKVGWYEHGAAPGEIGTASVLGHLDSVDGPAVFYELGSLKEGDRIFIMREDRNEVEFEVDSLERYRQEEFPTEMVYAPTTYPSLRLITCSGTYKKGAERYTHNLVVYAHLVGGEENGGALSSGSL